MGQQHGTANRMGRRISLRKADCSDVPSAPTLSGRQAMRGRVTGEGEEGKGGCGSRVASHHEAFA
jgi:hypothetical protein